MSDSARATLADRFPTVAATWHRERNGERALDTVSAKNSYKAWWRCPAGHEWQEVVSTRTSMPEWKAGDVAACRVCIGYDVIVTFDCGHTAEAGADFAEPERGCPDCRRRIWTDKQRAAQERGTAASAVYAGNEAEAQALLDQIAAPDLPAPLVFEWGRVALRMLRYALAGEAVDGTYGQVVTALDAVRELSSEMVPSVAALRAAAASAQPIEVAEKAHWPAGWLYWHDRMRLLRRQTILTSHPSPPCWRPHAARRSTPICALV
jgi:hypothetical protein